MRKITKHIQIGVVTLLFCMVSVFSYAKEQTPPGIEKKDAPPGQGEHKGWEQLKHKGWTKEEWLKLKENNPEEFKKLLQQRLGDIRQRLEQLKKSDPAKYQRIMQHIRQRRIVALRKLQKANPDKFKEILEKRKDVFQEKLEKLKADNPEKYRKVMERIENLKKGRSRGNNKALGGDAASNM